MPKFKITVFKDDGAKVDPESGETTKVDIGVSIAHEVAAEFPHGVAAEEEAEVLRQGHGGCRVSVEEVEG